MTSSLLEVAKSDLPTFKKLQHWQWSSACWTDAKISEAHAKLYRLINSHGYSKACGCMCSTKHWNNSFDTSKLSSNTTVMHAYSLIILSQLVFNREDQIHEYHLICTPSLRDQKFHSLPFCSNSVQFLPKIHVTPLNLCQNETLPCFSWPLCCSLAASKRCCFCAHFQASAKGSPSEFCASIHWSHSDSTSSGSSSKSRRCGLQRAKYKNCCKAPVTGPSSNVADLFCHNFLCRSSFWPRFV